jgi:hypothetical protein
MICAKRAEQEPVLVTVADPVKPSHSSKLETSGATRSAMIACPVGYKFAVKTIGGMPNQKNHKKKDGANKIKSYKR